MDNDAFRKLIATVLWGCLLLTESARCEEGNAVNDKSPVTNVVLTKTAAVVTHKLNMEKDNTVSLRINVDDIALPGFIEKLVLKPAGELFIVPPAGLELARNSALYPKVSKLGEDGEFDFKVDEFWKQLVGQTVTLTVEREGQEVGVDAKLSRQDNTDTLLANLRQGVKSRQDLEGKLLGFGKAGASDPLVLKLLVDQEKQQIVPINVAAVVAIKFDGGTIDKTALSLLKTQSEINRRVLTIKSAARRVNGLADMSVSYEQPISSAHAWKVRLHETNSQNDQTTIAAWAEIWNDTAYPWTNLVVTLKPTTDDSYTLKAVSLAAGTMGSFRIEETFALTFKDRLEVAAPEQDIVAKQVLVSEWRRVLTNNAETTLPEGTLTFKDKTCKDHTVNVSAIKKGKSATVSAGINPAIVVAYSRPEGTRIVRVDAIEGHRISYTSGRVAKFTFPKKVFSVSRENDKDKTTFIINLCGEKVLLTPFTEAKATIEPRWTGNDLLLGEISPAPLRAEANFFDAPRSTIKALKELLELRNPPSDNNAKSSALKTNFDRVVDGRGDIIATEDEINQKLQQLRDLELAQRRVAAQAASSRTGAILRDFANQIQRKQKEAFELRDKLSLQQAKLNELLLGTTPPP